MAASPSASAPRRQGRRRSQGRRPPRLMHPPSDRDALAALRRIRINGGEAVLTDPAAGLTWTLLEPRIDLRRAEDGGLAGEGEAVLRTGKVSVPVRLSGEARGVPMRV